MATSLKVSFDEREPLQLLLAAVARTNGTPTALEKDAGVMLHVRGNEITIEGEQGPFAERLLRQMYALAKAGRPLARNDVGRAIEVLRRDPQADLRVVFDDVVLAKGSHGRAIAPRSLAQKRYVDAIRTNTVTFGVGPAGTGKTYLAVAMAVRALEEKKVRRIILSRPAIEAGEHLGFLPGSLEEKISPYLRPLYDALHDMIDREKLARYMEHGEVEIAPLAYMRGRTLADAFVILDEAQNTTRAQMKMFLTRIGGGTTAVVTGDPSQVDLPGGHMSGLRNALHVLRGVGSVAVSTFRDSDVMRHPVVQAIVKAYDEDDEDRRERGRPGKNGAPVAVPPRGKRRRDS